jgi:hypothetical protein
VTELDFETGRVLIPTRTAWWLIIGMFSVSLTNIALTSSLYVMFIVHSYNSSSDRMLLHLQFIALCEHVRVVEQQFAMQSITLCPPLTHDLTQANAGNINLAP